MARYQIPDETEETTEPTDETSGTGEPSGSSDQSTPSDSTDPSITPTPEEYARELLDLTNAERAKKGYAPLVWSDVLANCAAVRAAEIPLLTADQNREHLRPDGQPWYTVNGYTYDTSPMWAENIAYGQMTAKQIFDAWMTSQTYYDNMMNPDYKTFGAALYITDSGYRYYWVEEFGY